jgi:hypothetical protein
MGVSAAVIMGATSLYEGYTQGEAAKAQGDYQKQMGDLNATLSDRASEEALQRGEKSSNRAIVQGRKSGDAARVASAASGVNPDTGSAADIVSENQDMGLKDALTIKNNAFREAWGYKVEAANSRSRGNFAADAGANEAGNTLLTGALRASSYGVKAYGDSRPARDNSSSFSPQTNNSSKYSGWWRN